MNIIFPSEIDFDSWNSLKKKIHFSTHFPPDFNEKEVWWISQGINIGSEMNGKPPRFTRPVLVLRKFIQNLLLSVSFSTKMKSNRYYLPVEFGGNTRYVIISQIHTISSKRLWNKIAELDENDFKRIIQNIKNFCLP